MILFNPWPLFFVGYWTICSVATLFGWETDFPRDGENIAEYDYDWDLEMAKQLDRKIRAIMMGSSWLPAAKYHGGGGKSDRKEQNETEKYAGPSESSGGFQWRARKSKPRTPSGNPNSSRPPGRRTTVRPNNSTQETGRQSKKDDPGVSRTTKHTGGGRKVFGDENDCVSANDGRPCVCYMTDFLDSVTQLLDEAKLVRDDTAAAVAAFACPSFKTVPPAFVVYPWPPPPPTETAVRLSGQRSDRKNKYKSADVAVVPARKKVDFDYVVNYQLEKSKDDHFRVHYYQLGSDIKIRCVSNKTGINAFKWQYKKEKVKSNSTITGTDTNNLSILNLGPEDSKNYTCVPITEAINGLNSRKNAYTHFVIAIDKPIYEIWGTAFYKTNSSSGCAQEIIDPMIKKLPGYVQTEICPEGLSQHACNVTVESSKCLKNENSLEIKYAVTLNDKANYLTRVRTSRKGQNALFYQKLLAKISNVLVGNLNKTLAVQIKSKYSLNDTYFISDLARMNVNKFVSCGPGFGIREVFCSACPPHHYSPAKSADCLKCSKGFYQPVAGSATCIKCPNFLVIGCNKINTKYAV